MKFAHIRNTLLMIFLLGVHHIRARGRTSIIIVVSEEGCDQIQKRLAIAGATGCGIPGPCNIPGPFDFGPPPDEIDCPTEFLDHFNFDRLDRFGIGP